MSWKIEVKHTAEKQYLELDQKMRKRVKNALRHLESEKYPLKQQNVRALTGHLSGDYRLRIGNLRILFSPNKKTRILTVYAILPLSKAY
jgi:mRNA-degrading endonuclease RelE of RelBE toxin-antitoxin system